MMLVLVKDGCFKRDFNGASRVAARRTAQIRDRDRFIEYTVQKPKCT